MIGKKIKAQLEILLAVIFTFCNYAIINALFLVFRNRFHRQVL
jgi:hypothetical protein